jgi:hypothetical protein
MAALSLPVLGLLTMLLTRLLNACHHFPGFVYECRKFALSTNILLEGGSGLDRDQY